MPHSRPMMNTSAQMIERRADDQDSRLAQRLAEEAEHAQAPDVTDDVAREPADLAGRREPFARQLPDSSFTHLITRICGCVASSVWVKT